MKSVGGEQVKLTSFHRSRRPKHTKKNKTKRLGYARAMKDHNWLNTAAADEFTTALEGSPNPQNQRYRAFSKDKVPPIGTSKGGVSESRLAIITKYGGVPLIPCQTNPNAEEMQQLWETAIPMIDEKMAGEQWCLLHDNCPGHAAGPTQTFLEDRLHALIGSDIYPGNSPDFNPAEKAIAMLKQRIALAGLRTRAQLVAFMDAEWAKIATPDQCQRWLKALPAKLAKCIEKKGGETER